MKKIAMIATDIALAGEKGLGRMFYLAELFCEKGYEVHLLTSRYQHWLKTFRTEEQMANIAAQSRCKVVFFDEMGVCFEFGFEIASEFRKLSLVKEAAELRNFSFRASSRLFDCDYFQNDRIFATRVYPWFRHPDSAHLKEPRREFIYNL